MYVQRQRRASAHASHQVQLEVKPARTGGRAAGLGALGCGRKRQEAAGWRSSGDLFAKPRSEFPGGDPRRLFFPCVLLGKRSSAVPCSGVSVWLPLGPDSALGAQQGGSPRSHTQSAGQGRALSSCRRRLQAVWKHWKEKYACVAYVGHENSNLFLNMLVKAQ